MQFFSPPHDQLHSQSPSSNCRTCRFPRAHEFHGFCQTSEFHITSQTHRKKTELMEKFGFVEKRIPAPRPTPFLN